jgi:hypothetical protein
VSEVRVLHGSPFLSRLRGVCSGREWKAFTDMMLTEYEMRGRGGTADTLS